MKVEAYKDSRGSLHETQEQQLKADSKYKLEDYMADNPIIYGYIYDCNITFRHLESWLNSENVVLLKEYLNSWEK